MRGRLARKGKESEVVEREQRRSHYSTTHRCSSIPLALQSATRSATRLHLPAIKLEPKRGPRRSRPLVQSFCGFTGHGTGGLHISRTARCTLLHACTATVASAYAHGIHRASFVPFCASFASQCHECHGSRSDPRRAVLSLACRAPCVSLRPVYRA